MRANIAVAALSALSVAVAQTAQDFTIDPNSVALNTRANWCSAETNTCDTLCAKNSKDNTCDPNTLKYTCTCSSNSSSPGLQYYTQTMYTFVCQEAYSQCITANQNNAAGQTNCTNSIQAKCGTLDPNKAEVGGSSTSSSASTSATKSPSGSGTGSAASATTTNTSKNAAPTAGILGNGAAVVAAGAFVAALL